MMEAATPGIPYTILVFLILLSVLVFIHEWGHYIVARIFGVKIETFSIGFGREIFGWTDKKETRWKIGWVPLGGYVKFFGDATAVSNPAAMLSKIPVAERDKCFHFKPVWQRFLIVFAGPAINVIFAVVLFSGLFATVGEDVTAPVINRFGENSVAEASGFQIGDRILEINGNSIQNFNDMSPILLMRGGEETHFLVERGGQAIEILATLEKITEKDRFGNVYTYGRLGIWSDTVINKKYQLPEAIVEGTSYTFTTFGLMLENILFSKSKSFSE